MGIVDNISWAMSLRDPQKEALGYFDAISSGIDYKKRIKEDAEKVATEHCQSGHEIKVAKEFSFPSFCFDMTTGIGKTRLMGACIYYLYRTKGYRHFFILTPGNTIYDKLRKEAQPSHPKYFFKGLEAEMGRPRVFDGENYINYPTEYDQNNIVYQKTSEIELFIFNIGKIFMRGDVEFKFHEFRETLGGSFSDVLRSFDDLVICMDEAHRYYAPASMKAIDHLNPVLGLEFTATPKSTDHNIIYSYGLEKGAGKYLKIPVVMGRSNTAGYSEDDIEEMKLKDGIKLHERRKKIVYQYCSENNLPQVKPIVLIACKDTKHAEKIRGIIDSDSFFGGRYIGKVIRIDSGTSAVESDENIRKLLTIEENTNPVEIVLHVYKLKEGWDVNNLFTIIPLNAAKSDILALQTIGRGLRLPFGEITGIEELDTLDIVAHDHYRELVEDIKNNAIFKERDLDKEEVAETKSVEVTTRIGENGQLELIDTALAASGVKSFTEVLDEGTKSSADLYKAYKKAFIENVSPKKQKDDEQYHQVTFEELMNSKDSETSVNTESKTQDLPSLNKEAIKTENKNVNRTIKSLTPLSQERFEEALKQLKKVAISVPKIAISYSSTVQFHPFEVKRNVMGFDLAASKIERFDTINGSFLKEVEADSLTIDDPVNLLACALLEAIPELSSDDADFILNVVNQYMEQLDGDEEQKRRIVRKYAKLIVNDLAEQIHKAEEVNTELVYNVQKDLIVFGSSIKTIKPDGAVNFRTEIPDKKNIKQYLFTGYRKSYYPSNGFDSDDERRLSVVFEDDNEVLKFIKPPLNQLGLFYKAGNQYNPDFLVETPTTKYMVEVKAKNQTKNEDVLEKANAGIKWCECASKVDPDHKPWVYKMIPGDVIMIGEPFSFMVKNAEHIDVNE